MRVLVGCEFSAIVRDEFRKLGHDAYSCDLLPCEGDTKWHIQGNLFDQLYYHSPANMGTEGWRDDARWDLLIFHWPCTHMLLSGVRWFTTIPKKKKPGILYGEARKRAMVKDAKSFKALLECGIPMICGENPTMCGEAQRIIGHPWTQRIQPWQFGHGETKATYLWLVNLPLLQPTHREQDLFCKPEPIERIQRVHLCSPGPNRWRERSRTFTGIAKAMAEQWGTFGQKNIYEHHQPTGGLFNVL